MDLVGAFRRLIPEERMNAAQDLRTLQWVVLEYVIAAVGRVLDHAETRTMANTSINASLERLVDAVAPSKIQELRSLQKQGWRELRNKLIAHLDARALATSGGQEAASGAAVHWPSWQEAARFVDRLAAFLGEVCKEGRLDTDKAPAEVAGRQGSLEWGPIVGALRIVRHVDGAFQEAMGHVDPACRTEAAKAFYETLARYGEQPMPDERR